MSLKKLYYVLGIFYLSIVTSCSFSSPIKSSRNGKLILPKKRDLKVDSNLDGIETPGNANHNIPEAEVAAALPPAAVEEAAEVVVEVAVEPVVAAPVVAVAEEPVAEAAAAQEAAAQEAATAIKTSVATISTNARDIKKTDMTGLIQNVGALIALTKTINAPSQEVLTSVRNSTRNLVGLSLNYFRASVQGNSHPLVRTIMEEFLKVNRASVTDKDSLLAVVKTAMDYLTNTVIPKLPN